nr:immunoglobulin heavy chain junction region [Macaca mulatta]MOW82241.1 immunoglobulin heavy chain junction region [Macaca mulatta]MOW83701.1 immunoglobulin heavy chain junction region [Macaca mulatta]
CTRDQSGFDFW